VRGVRGLVDQAPRAVDVAVIERELEALWRASAAVADPEHPVIRACMSNLLVVCKTDQEAGVVMGELPEILARHPARALVLVADEAAGGDELDAYVAAHCHRREAGDVCGESVTLLGRGRAVGRLSSTARSLLLGDLSTTLWWATPEAPALGGGLYTELAAMARQIVFDSLGWLDPVRSMTAMTRLLRDRPGGPGSGRPPLLHDICWRRLRGWRRVLSQGLDPVFAPGTLEHAAELALEHGPHGLTQAWLLVGWLACRLGWKAEAGKVAAGTEVSWRFTTRSGPLRVMIRRLPEGPPEIRSLRLTPAPGRAAAPVVAESLGEGRLTIRSEAPAGGSRNLALPAGSQAAMVARQLSDLAPDPLFHATLAVACAMAGSLHP
jgi:glucose-6-phosphate dehydrogenase assembly protein OpcA